MRAEVLKGHLDTLILSTLAAGPAHGYALIEALKAGSRGVLDLPEGTVYPALHRLEDAGLLRSRWSEHAGRKRRMYALSSAGRRRLKQYRSEWQQLRAVVSTFLGEPWARPT